MHLFHKNRYYFPSNTTIKTGNYLSNALELNAANEGFIFL